MATQFTPCSACGALGEVGEMCQFCGTPIELKEGAILSNTRLVHHRTITPQQYADKISIYHNVKKVGLDVLSVSIGKQYGLINLNGDLIYPLGDLEIIAVRGNIIQFYESAFRKSRYLNLENGQYADHYGFVADEDNPNRLHRINIENNWESINTYVNLAGITYSLDYAEYLDICELHTYLFHSGNTCALYIPEINLSQWGYADKQECILEGIVNIEKSKNSVSITTQNNKGTVNTFVITGAYYGNYGYFFHNLCKSSGFITPIENERTFTSIRRLNNNQRKDEIARLIAGSNITEKTMEHATEIIELAKRSL